jgi:hypothetical protein
VIRAASNASIALTRLAKRPTSHSNAETSNSTSIMLNQSITHNRTKSFNSTLADEAIRNSGTRRRYEVKRGNGRWIVWIRIVVVM